MFKNAEKKLGGVINVLFWFNAAVFIPISAFIFWGLGFKIDRIIVENSDNISLKEEPVYIFFYGCIVFFAGLIIAVFLELMGYFIALWIMSYIELISLTRKISENTTPITSQKTEILNTPSGFGNPGTNV